MTEKPQEQKKPKSQLAKNMEEFVEKDAKKSKERHTLATPEAFKIGVEQESQQYDRLKDPKLLVDVIKEVQKEVSGEEDSIIATIIVQNTRMVKNASAESKNLFLSDKTGIGKDFTIKKTLDVVVPKNALLHVTKMSPEAFTYWHYKEDGWTWENKAIHIEDIPQSLLDCSTFKTMASGDNYAVVVKDQKTIEIPINGKPVMIITSHHVNPQDEALRRFPIGGLDDSEEQTRSIKNKVSQRYSGREQTKSDEELRHAVQCLLKPYEVIVPYAEILQFFFPDSTLMRTHYRRFLDYICSSAVFHQYQREKTKDGRLIAAPDDYMIARLVLMYTTSNPSMISVSKEYRDLLKVLQENIEPMTMNEIFTHYDKSKDWLYKHIPNLKTFGLIEIGKKPDERANKDVMTYKYAPDINPDAIPTWNDIGKKLVKMMNKTNKTNNTPPSSLLERWFYSNKIKPIIPPHEEDGVSLVLFGVNNTFNRKVLLVLLVLGCFLRERNEKRYKRYLDDRVESTEIEQKELLLGDVAVQQTPDQANEIRQLADFIKTSKNEDGFVKEKSILSFLKCVLKKSNPDKYYETLLQRATLTFYSGQGVQWTGGEI